MPLKDPDALRQYKREWERRRYAKPEQRQHTRALQRASTRRRYHTDDQYRERTLKANRLRKRLRRYGLTVADYYRLLEDQGFCCASCGDDLDFSVPTNVHVDHCHAAGRVRGVLCKSCNNALGFLRDDLERIDKLRAYAARTAV